MKPANESGQVQPNNHRNVVSWLLIGMVMIALLLLTWKTAAAVQPGLAGSRQLPPDGSVKSPNIVLSAVSGSTITFAEQKRSGGKDLPTQLKAIPHLVLYRNGDLTAAPERTLTMTISNLEIPSTDMTVSLLLETQDGDPDLGGGEHNRIVVWQDTQRLENTLGTTQARGEVSFEVMFPENFGNDRQMKPTPTGYYRFELVVRDESQPESRPLISVSQEYALLLERQWIAPLDDSSGPRELAIYFCDMLLFEGVSRTASGRLLRADVPGYIQTEIVPLMLAAVRLQTEGWGFSWKGWESFNASASRERLEVILSDGKTWYRGPAPDLGHASIAINVNANDNTAYDSLSDALMSTFHHELFHNLQRALAFSSGGDGDISGKDAAWHFFSEGTASFVATVAQPEIQLAQSKQPRAYLAKAVKFVGGKGFTGELNTSYVDLNPYYSAMYWRFLYEQCGGFTSSSEVSLTGMGVIRRTLQVLYAKGIVDISASTDLVGSIGLVMDQVLTSPEAAGCPFHNYVDSLVHFARTIYSLRLMGGRCSMPGVPEGCGFYDPNNLYSAPNIRALAYSGARLISSTTDQPNPAGIKSSFGMDFIDLELRPEVDGQPLTIQFAPSTQGEAEFHVQIIKLQKAGRSGFSSQTLFQVTPPENLEEEKLAGMLTLTISAIDLDTYNRIGIIITRVDDREHLDPVGAYTLTISPDR